MEEENTPVVQDVEIFDVQEDRGSNNGNGSTTSQSSEEFVKVNQDDAPIDEGAGDVTHKDVEEVAPVEESHSGLEKKMIDKLDPRATENMASENYLQDYYKQLPSETAELETESRDFSDEGGDLVSPLSPEVLSNEDSFPSHSPYEIEANMSMGGGHHTFEPVPSASFEPEPTVDADSLSAQQLTTNGDVMINEQSLNQELQDPIEMSSEQENPETAFAEDDKNPPMEAEAESPPLVLVEDVYEDEEEVVTEDTPTPHQEPEPIQAPPEEQEEKSEVIPPAQVVGVEEVETKPSPVSLSSHVPAAADETKEEEQAKDPANEGWRKTVVDLLYWRDIKKTAFVFSFLLLILGSLVYFSVISVFAYAGLAFLTVTVAFRLYKLVLQTLNGTQQPHPFQDLLDCDVTLSQEHVQKYTSAVLSHLNCTITTARNLFLVQNTISSLKFGVFLWLLTYIGCCFNGLTLLIIDIILAFTVPPVYEKYQTQIDNYYGMAREKTLALMATAKSKFPGAKQAKEKAQ